ncbi:MAG: hypothetical protein ACJ74E_03915, partial [Actinomycetes bacterium]
RQYRLPPDHTGGPKTSGSTAGGRGTNGAGRRHRTGGRHRAPEARPETPQGSTIERVTSQGPPRVLSRDQRGEMQHAALVHTLRVGVISAVLVLAIFVGTLLVLALWLP